MSKSTLMEMFKLRAEGKCPFCKKDMKDATFRDELSRKEFGMSGLCQECQDGFYEE